MFYFFLPNNICVVIRGETDKKQGDIHVKSFTCMRLKNESVRSLLGK